MLTLSLFALANFWSVLSSCVLESCNRRLRKAQSRELNPVLSLRMPPLCSTPSLTISFILSVSVCVYVLCTRTCLCGYTMLTGICAHTYILVQRSVLGWLPQLHSTFFGGRQALFIEPTACHFSNWLASKLWGFSCLLLPVLRLQLFRATPGIFRGCWEPRLRSSFSQESLCPDFSLQAPSLSATLTSANRLEVRPTKHGGLHVEMS